MGHEEQPRSLRHHLLPLDARYPGRALTSSAAPLAPGASGCDFPRASQHPRVPRTLSQFPCPAQELDFLETLRLPWGERASRREVQLSSRDPELLCPSLGCPSAGEEEGGRAALCDTEGVPSAVGSISQEVAWAPESFPPNKALLLVFGLIWREGSPQERQSG